ncbi:hypothetical protein COOONC_28031 [Cooperia oncophora]
MEEVATGIEGFWLLLGSDEDFVVVRTIAAFPRAYCFIGEIGKNRWWGDASFAYRMRLLPQSLAAALYRHPVPYAAMSSKTNSGSDIEKPSFRPKKVLILSKITRYEYEKRIHGEDDDKKLEDLLRRRGSDYNQLIRKHQIHQTYLQTMQSELERAGVEARVVQRFDYTEDAVKWADAVMTAGGDGTFLLAASRIHQKR